MSSYLRKPSIGKTDWFVNDRFGMFIHFGLYSMPARHEWIKQIECIPDEKYEKYFKYFNPDLFDAKAWAKSCKKAGMKYVVLTTKHHEGFCLFDTKYTDYKITNTAYGKDLVREYVDAFRAEGIKIGFYYSLLDWHHEDYVIDHRHPLRNDPNAVEMNKTRDMKKYAKYMRDQVTELLTNYGKIDILWFDFSYPDEPKKEPYIGKFKGKGKEDWEAEELINTVRSLQPDIIINNRTGIEQDIMTPEQFQPTEWIKDENGELYTWEACQTFSGSWGYHRDEQTWKSPEMLINMLTNTVSLGGNLIMNVGPTSRGYIDYRAEEALNVYAEWMKVNSRSIYGCTMAEPEFTAPKGTVLTQSEDGKRLYVHLQDYPFVELHFPTLNIDRIDYAQILSDGSEVLYKVRPAKFCGGTYLEAGEGNDYPVFYLPAIKPHGICPVLEIFLK